MASIKKGHVCCQRTRLAFWMLLTGYFMVLCAVSFWHSRSTTTSSFQWLSATSTQKEFLLDRLNYQQQVNVFENKSRGSSVIENATSEVASSKKTRNKNDSSHKKIFSQQQVARRHPPSTAIIKDTEDLLLSVPFYVYKDLLWQELNLTLAGLPVQDLEQVHGLTKKHMDDYYFAQAALRHPMRVLDPSQAKLFVIPTLLNLVAEDLRFLRRGICISPIKFDNNSNSQMKTNNNNNRICDRKLFEHIHEFLSKSPWFERSQGSDHIFVASHWAINVQQKAVIKTLLRKCHAVNFEDRKFNDPDRWSMPSYYVGERRCLDQYEHSSRDRGEERIHGVVFVGTMKNISQFKPRQKACGFLKRNVTTREREILSMEICGKGSLCPALIRAKLGLHLRGDTLGSSRVMDLILSGTVPVFTNPQQYVILPTWIDWRALTYLVSPIRHDLPSRLADILKDKTEYELKLANLICGQPLFDWKTLRPFDTYLFMLQCHLWPKLCDTSRPGFTKYAPVLLDPKVSKKRRSFNEKQAFMVKQIKKQVQERQDFWRSKYR